VKDLIIGLATNYDWPVVEPFAVSLVRSGYAGDKVLFVRDLTDAAKKNLQALGFGLVEVSEPMDKYNACVVRFLLIHRYLAEHPGYRFVICSDVRDVIFQSDPTVWLACNIGDSKLVAASEQITHHDQVGNADWVRQGFKEVESWMLSKLVYCSGFISGEAEYMSDLSLGIYLAARYMTHILNIGADQPVFNTIMHQRPYADVTLVPKLSDHYCINLHNLSLTSHRPRMTERPDIAPFDTHGESMVGTLALMWNYGIPNLDRFAVLHQYDRILPLRLQLQKEYSLASVTKRSLHVRPTQF
jgi:hypothetical protein